MTATPSLSDFLKTLPAGAPIGVAVSGGSDSMALLHLLAHAPCMVCACTVHHHLRDEAGAEARFVAEYCATHNIPHDTLHWHWDGQGNLQDQARRARYRLLSKWAQDRGLSHVALGHTADDNIETFLMGLSRGAGLDGLSGMRPSFERSGVAFHRPLLEVRRENLRDLLTFAGQTWFDDPSNDDPAYHRIRLRQGRAALDALGLTSDMLLKTISNLRATRRDINLKLAADVARIATLDHGDVCLQLEWFNAATSEEQRRVLNAALRYVSGVDYPPRGKKVMQYLAVRETSATLHGCYLSQDDGVLRIGREAAAAAQCIVTSRDVWDQRWRAFGPHSKTTFLRALGEDGIAACPEGWRALGLPRATVLASASVWDGEVLIAAPLAGWSNGWEINLCAKPPAVLASILSH